MAALYQPPLPLNKVELDVVQPIQPLADELTNLYRKVPPVGVHIEEKRRRDLKEEEKKTTWPPIRLGRRRPQPSDLADIW
jgi:hypothetical protein